MRFNLTALGLALTLTQPLAAQGRYALSLGGIWSTPIVTDHIFNDIDLQPALAPVVTLNGSWPVSKKARLGAEASFASGKLDTKESGQSVDIGTLRSLTVTGGVEAPLTGKLWGRLGGGFIKYLPSEEEGVFQNGDRCAGCWVSVWTIAGNGNLAGNGSRDSAMTFIASRPTSSWRRDSAGPRTSIA